ncbi:MAG TPA: MlaD family protein [Rhizomicrobium sp.]|jgi:phospholipid/cholesterol/gamma-HCH transport system substrate-binding protein|nr:MlaD family protein [Rhizomicrobium sp.]
METKANYVAVGAFVLICMLGVVVALLWLAGIQYSQEYEYFQTAFKGPVTGLGNGTTVRYNGIDVGRVTDLRFDPNDPGKVIVKLQVKPDLHIRQDSEASIESQGLTGGSYVEISGGTKDSPELEAPPGQIPTIKSSPSTLQQLEESAPQLFDKLNHAADKINRLLSDENVKNFSGLLANFNATSKNLAEITAPLARRSGDIETMIGNLSRASARIEPTLSDADESIKKFGKLSADADAFVNGEGLGQLADLLRETRGLVASLKRLSDELDRQPTKLLFGDRHKGYTPK